MEITETNFDFRPVEIDDLGRRQMAEWRSADLLTFTLHDAGDLEFVRIPHGTFLMGSLDSELGSRSSERPLHQVMIETFYLGRIPITQGQWKSLTGLDCRGSIEAISDGLPLVNVWLDEAISLCKILSEKMGRIVRLPSEAEWEYTCRANTKTAFCYGDSLTPGIANYAAADSTAGGLAASGQSEAPNAFGLLDMHGNIWEWCADVWHVDYEGAPNDGQPWITGGDPGYCVQRGGSWRSPMSTCRSASRVGDIARNDEDIVGLRVCFTP